MSRRLVTAGLSLAVLWSAASDFGRVIAKPPDLPIIENDALNSPPVIAVEGYAPGLQLFPAAPSESPSMEIPSLFQLRPSVRRMAVSCLLYSVHPLLALAPAEQYLDFDEEDYAPAPAKVLVVSHPAVSDAPSECPYMRQQQCAPDRQAVLFADPDFSRDVLQNLEALRQARALLDEARELSRDGQAIEAFGALAAAANLCPGSRLDEEIQAAAVEILAGGSGAASERAGLAAAGASEEQGAPVDLLPHGSIEFDIGCDGGFRVFAQFERGGPIWHVEFDQKGLSWWAAPDGAADVTAGKDSGH